MHAIEHGALRLRGDFLNTREQAAAILADRSTGRFLRPDLGVMFQAIPDCFADLMGFVYVISPIEGKVAKIGYCRDHLCSRLSTLQTGVWAELEMYAAVGIYGPLARTVEKVAHQLAPKRAKRLRGEWFEMEPGEALEVIVEAAEKAGATSRSVSQCWWHGVTRLVERSEIPEIDVEAEEAERRRVLRKKLGMD